MAGALGILGLLRLELRPNQRRGGDPLAAGPRPPRAPEDPATPAGSAVLGPDRGRKRDAGGASLLRRPDVHLDHRRGPEQLLQAVGSACSTGPAAARVSVTALASNVVMSAFMAPSLRSPASGVNNVGRA